MAGTRTAIIGAGRLARTLLTLLDRGSFPVVAVVARRLKSARAAVGDRRGVQATTSLRRAVEPARLVLLAVPDREIAGVAARLAGLDRIDWTKRVVLHHAGSLGQRPLDPLELRGASTGVLHPLQCLGSGARSAELLRGSRARIEGDARARREAERIAETLGLVPLSLPHGLGDAGREAYHAAASLVSNDVVALAAIAIDLLSSAGLTRAEALEALMPLARGTLAQLEQGGPGGALTGPASRGDAETIRAHLRRLSERSADDAEAHRMLSRRLARLARTLERLDEPSARRILRVAGPRRSRTV